MCTWKYIDWKIYHKVRSTFVINVTENKALLNNLERWNNALFRTITEALATLQWLRRKVSMKNCCIQKKMESYSTFKSEMLYFNNINCCLALAVTFLFKYVADCLQWLYCTFLGCWVTKMGTHSHGCNLTVPRMAHIISLIW